MRPILLERCRRRAPNALRALALQQNDDVKAVAAPFGTKRRAQGGDRAGCHLASDERPHHGIVLERATAVLAALDDRGQPVLGDDHQGRQFLVQRRRSRGDRDVRGQRIAVDPRVHGQARVRLLRGLRDLAPHGGLFAAHQLFTTVDDRLRRVDAVRAEDAAVVLLAFGRERQRCGILPSQLIPVGHVHPERNHLHARRRRLSRELAEDGVGRRAARTALRGEQLDDDRYAIGWRWLHCRQGNRGDRDDEHDRRFHSRLSCLLSSVLAGPHPRSLSLSCFAPRSGRRRYFLFASTSIVTWISSPTTGPASMSALYCRPKSRRFRVVVADPPIFCPCCVLIGGEGESTFSVTSLVTPCSVRSPISLSGPCPLPSTRLDLKVAVGNFATSKKLDDLRSLSRVSLPVS